MEIVNEFIVIESLGHCLIDSLPSNQRANISIYPNGIV